MKTHNKLPTSFNKDTSETKQVAEEWSGLNQEKDCLEILSNGSCLNKCKSLPLAPNKLKIKEKK